MNPRHPLTDTDRWLAHLYLRCYGTICHAFESSDMQFSDGERAIHRQ